MDKRGASSIIINVLLVLIAFAAIVLVWTAVSTILNSGGKDTNSFLDNFNKELFGTKEFSEEEQEGTATSGSSGGSSGSPGSSSDSSGTAGTTPTYILNQQTSNLESSLGEKCYIKLSLEEKGSYIRQKHLFLDGSSCISLTENPDALKLNEGTILAWVKTNYAGDSFRGIVTKQYAYGSFLLDNSPSTYDWNKNQETSTQENIADGVWHLVALSFKNSQVDGSKLYLDGILNQTFTYNIANQEHALSIGCGDNPGTIQFFNGAIDDVMIFSRILNETEIEDIYSGYFINQSLVSYFPFDDSFNETIDNYQYQIIGNPIIEEEKIDFSFSNSETIYGAYDGLVNNYDSEIPGQFALNTYDHSGNLLNKYSLESSRLVLYDNFGDEQNPGGMIELMQSQNNLVIPYDARIYSIKVEQNGKEQEIGFSMSACERTCKIENETGYFNQDECCLGFTPSRQDENTFVCTNCGDDVCSEYENEYSCYADCKQEFTCPENLILGNYGCLDIKEYWCNGADINEDGFVNSADYALMDNAFNFQSQMGNCSASNYWCACSLTGAWNCSTYYTRTLNKASPPKPELRHGPDLTQDGFVNSADYALMDNAFNFNNINCTGPEITESLTEISDSVITGQVIKENNQKPSWIIEIISYLVAFLVCVTAFIHLIKLKKKRK